MVHEPLVSQYRKLSCRNNKIVLDWILINTGCFIFIRDWRFVTNANIVFLSSKNSNLLCYYCYRFKITLIFLFIRFLSIGRTYCNAISIGCFDRRIINEYAYLANGMRNSDTLHLVNVPSSERLTLGVFAVGINISYPRISIPPACWLIPFLSFYCGVISQLVISCCVSTFYRISLCVCMKRIS